MRRTLKSQTKKIQNRTTIDSFYPSSNKSSANSLTKKRTKSKQKQKSNNKKLLDFSLQKTQTGFFHATLQNNSKNGLQIDNESSEPDIEYFTIIDKIYRKQVEFDHSSKTMPEVVFYFLGAALQDLRKKSQKMTLNQWRKKCDTIYRKSLRSDLTDFVNIMKEYFSKNQGKKNRQKSQQKVVDLIVWEAKKEKVNNQEKSFRKEIIKQQQKKQSLQQRIATYKGMKKMMKTVESISMTPARSRRVSCQSQRRNKQIQICEENQQAELIERKQKKTNLFEQIPISNSFDLVPQKYMAVNPQTRQCVFKSLEKKMQNCFQITKKPNVDRFHSRDKDRNQMNNSKVLLDSITLNMKNINKVFSDIPPANQAVRKSSAPKINYLSDQFNSKPKDEFLYNKNNSKQNGSLFAARMRCMELKRNDKLQKISNQLEESIKANAMKIQNSKNI